MTGTPNYDFSEFWTDVDPEELARQQHKPFGKANALGGDWPDPDMGVMSLRRRAPPKLPLAAFGEEWGRWIEDAAKAAACPADYVAMPLLASASALIGNARWAQA